jgi:NAD(P)H-hydrate repair Nnr-like enzyme with NAD(P)H-hydrate dehydratase domain
LSRLFGATQTSASGERLIGSSLETLAQLLNSVIVAKGPMTRIVSPTQGASSTTGTAALAKAGTGDVLSGIIGSLMAQGISAYEAAILGVEIHGQAGRIAEQKLGRRSVCAEDVIEAIPTVLQKLDALI